MKSVKEILLSYTVFNGIKIENLMILKKAWEEEMKPFLNMCELYSYEKKNLFVKVKNPVIKNEIFLRKDDILKRLNKYFKSKFIKDIKFV